MDSRQVFPCDTRSGKVKAVNVQALAAENAWLKRTLDGVRQSAFEVADLLSLILQETNAGEELRATPPAKLMEAGFTRSQISMALPTNALAAGRLWAGSCICGQEGQ